jgi:hypothetical protein
MTRPLLRPERYRKQLTRWVRTLATPQEEVGGGPPAGELPAAAVREFAEGLFAKRHDKLRKDHASVAAAFDAFEDLLAAYVRDVPMATYGAGPDDAEAFLDWLERTRRLTPEQGDHVACQRARRAVEAEARKDRAGHVRFQALWKAMARGTAGPAATDGLWIRLNPIRVWSRFTTAALLDEDTPPPADVLFFPVDGSVHTAVLEPAGQALLSELAARCPCTVGEWLRQSERADPAEALSAVRDLAEMGLVAVNE